MNTLDDNNTHKTTKQQFTQDNNSHKSRIVVHFLPGRTEDNHSHDCQLQNREMKLGLSNMDC